MIDFEKYLDSTVENYQDFWKTIVAEYSSDYWKLAHSHDWLWDTFGHQLRGRVVDKIDDIVKINFVEKCIINNETFIKVMYDSYLGKTTLIPITWFEDRDKHCEKWKIVAKADYITQIKDGIDRSEKYITKLKRELNRIEENE